MFIKMKGVGACRFADPLRVLLRMPHRTRSVTPHVAMRVCCGRGARHVGEFP